MLRDIKKKGNNPYCPIKIKIKLLEAGKSLILLDILFEIKK